MSKEITVYEFLVNGFVNSAMRQIVNGAAVRDAIARAQHSHEECMDSATIAAAKRQVLRSVRNPKAMADYRLIYEE